MTETPNLIYIKELAAGSEDFEQKLIQIVKREFPEEKEEFLNNYKQQVFSKAAENVHKLKNKIGMMGFEEGYQVTIDFEEELKGNNPTLYPEFMLILDSIEHFLQTLQ
ncbi:Hpt domain-containing protein [Aquimarina sp. 2201CG5-10]|uniref:Hpt domain-containing protein n=1 Tax=Aquimarina callyspongiae TaxID=3098150 RepID=UPI002AB34CCE|nr:Hpt domain-containing protein [Aquimarina sp. 2201CG5-10]MDY8134639.1 Hpt domain-containing protein [Aquimarina sp. 2201CG5-10]